MDRVEKLQRPDGSVPAYPGVDWVCTTGVAQYAVIWYKLGRRAAGDRAMDCLMRRQNRSGGFFGSYGRGAEYFPDKEISWAVKFFLDASWWRVRSAFEAEAAKDYPEHLSPDDGRLAGLVHELAGTRRILDAGCGKGRYLKALQARDSGLELWGVDVSVEMLHHISPEIRTRRAELVNLPFPDSHFDAVYCIEALEHALLPEQSIRELCRVVRPGGKVILIDKNERFRGAMRRAPWEQWFDRETVEAWLGNWCGEVGSRFIGYDGHPDPTGLFILWRGIRR